MNKDVLGGLVLLAVAGVYHWASGQIADSTLSDEVGAAGLPRLLTYALAGLAVLLLVRAVAARRAVKAAADPEGRDIAGMGRALGLLGLGGLYVVLLPFLGYLLAVALLITGVAVYERAKMRWTLPVIAIGGAVLYWALFVKLLGVNQAAGSLWKGLL